MWDVPSFREQLISQIPALQLLMALGYEYLSPEQALRLRGGRVSEVVLDAVLEGWLREHNAIAFKGQTHPFSQANIRSAMRTLTGEPVGPGLIPASERVYELLTLGTSLPQTIAGDTKSYSLRYVDWQHPERNVYHVTDEFPVQRPGSHETRRPDVVLFINGIPVVVIECKRPDLERAGERAVAEAVSQMIRNQRAGEIPTLFLYTQLLLAISVNDALYATTGTPKAFWSVWQEEAVDVDADLRPLVNRRLNEGEKRLLYAWRQDAGAVRAYFEEQEAAGERLPTAQDRTLYALLRPERLLELIYQFILYDGGAKKIARHQQYFAVRHTMHRVAHLNHQATRTGGVIWHTTGSGKSLTMVMLAKALALHPNITNPRAVIVTDRINLDDQIWRTFHACGKGVERARSGAHLVEMIRAGNVDIITTVIDKFDAAAKAGVRDEGVDIFVLVDESHRSQYGEAHARMRQVFPRACYIGFTGTPLLKAEKSTAQRFGGFIHKYSMRQAVADSAVVPLLYEGRMAELAVDQEGIDRWFERVTRDLTDEQKRDLKHKFSRAEAISRAEQRIRQVAYDIGDHYARNWQGTGFKAQLAASSKAVALKYRQYLDEFGPVSSAVVISAPDTREGSEEIDAPQAPEVEAFWKRMMARYGDEEAYNREIIADFAREDGVEILIVVDKLLVGFDEPRNTVLYIDKPLKEHGLLQAIARVNRIFEGKDFGYVVDYRGVLGELDEAMQTYNALEGYDAEDVAGTVSDVAAEIARLPQAHSDLWAVFRSVPNRRDVEALQRFLEPEDLRDRFYEALTAYSRRLKVALGSVSFYDDTPAGRIATYKHDLAFLHNLRVAVRRRYAETVDYRDYEHKVSKLLDSHIQSYEVPLITEQVNIFDVERFEQEVARLGTPAAQADTIAHRVKQTISELVERDPAFYNRFSRMIEETIEAYRRGRMDELEYLRRAREILQQVRTGRDASLPARLGRYRHAPAYYGILREPLRRYEVGGLDLDDACADMAIALEGIIEAHKVRDWTTNLDVQNEMKRAMEEQLYLAKERYAIPLSGGDLDVILDGLIDAAKHRDAL
jgi:type I restriction enzyme R subunit